MRPLLPALCAAALTWPAAAQTVTSDRADWIAAATVEVDLNNFSFTPSRIVLQRGVPYHLHLVNKAPGSHDFDAKDFFESAKTDPAGRTLLNKGKISIRGNQSADINVIPTQVGHFSIICTHLMHATMGMRGVIEVE